MHDQPAMIGAQGFFANSHDLVIHHPVMYSINEATEKGAGMAEFCDSCLTMLPVLQWLSRYTMSGAEFDSSTRDPPPRCHPGTRIEILETIHHWIADTQRVCHLLWLNGPAGVGKSAIIQTLAEELSLTPKLGATLFFSGPNNCHKPSLVFPTIAYQLAVRISRYREYLKQKMIGDPKLLEKGMEHQFKILIVEPFTSLRLRTESGRWSILLDGLDECDGEDAQILIVKLIGGFLRQYPAAPLTWVISSRPEVHLNLAFESSEVSGTFWVHDVPANSDAACRDVEQFLRARFQEIHHRYRDLIPIGVSWPVERDIVRICNASSGLFVFPSMVVRFIDDPHVCDPVSQLTTILSVTDNLQTSALSSLHAFYSRILDDIPKSMLPILKLLLGWTLTTRVIEVDADVEELPLVVNATVFGLQQHTVYAALRKLHSVIKVPSPEESGLRDIRFYHASFADYLRDASKSGDHAIDFGHVNTKVWWGYFSMLTGNSRELTFPHSIYVCKSSLSRPVDQDTIPRPPVRLSWDSGSHPSHDTIDCLWEEALYDLIHGLIPGALCHNGPSGHFQISLTATEMQNAFGEIDFSRLIFRHSRDWIIDPFSDLINLYKWLKCDVSATD